MLLVLWAGSLWALALWIAPTLFSAQPDRHLAGVLASRLFTVETYLGIAVVLVAFALRHAGRLRSLCVSVALLAVNEWIIKRFMEQAHAQGAALGLTFGAWHGIAGAAYIIGCLLVLRVIWQGPI